ncbi:hypothetical protein BGZ97_012969 [Linnemannia gamsii]|uniref:Uncharacterized protein n=1 Tax=Linnemannia gamsii TaxID=64522 RepID=A0A9P6UJY7_9FUNG|nr:hypothetical protein BGZ97_012969 [Linnemannia gamsii]
MRGTRWCKEARRGVELGSFQDYRGRRAIHRLHLSFRHHIAQDQPTSPSTIQIGRNPEIASSKGFSGPSKGRHAFETLRNRQEELTKSARLKVEFMVLMD